VKQRGIIMRDWEVRAIREGRKTQFRRLVKQFIKPSDYEAFLQSDQNEANLLKLSKKCTLGRSGDGLWVKEAFRLFNSFVECACYDDCSCASKNGRPIYRANCNSEDKWTPSIHMPRWASRITLEIVSVRAQRLLDITEEDAIAEGCSPETRAEGTLFRGSIHPVKGTHKVFPCAKAAYRDIWESINGPGSWDRNDFVFAVEFKEIGP
jgi:hypothetical protein